MDKAKLDNIREYIVNNIMRDGVTMHNCEVRDTFNSVDLIDVIASLYEELHREVTGEEYNYMFHWANKVGSWCQDNLFMEYKDGLFTLTDGPHYWVLMAEEKYCEDDTEIVEYSAMHHATIESARMELGQAMGDDWGDHIKSIEIKEVSYDHFS